VLKGKLDKDKTIKVLHYRLPQGVQCANGPCLVSFRKDRIVLKGVAKGSKVRPEYLLFLRARPDGRYEPVSGQIDPALSMRELQPADNFLSGFDRK
jgi:hypothetical protein